MLSLHSVVQQNGAYQSLKGGHQGHLKDYTKPWLLACYIRAFERSKQALPRATYYLKVCSVNFDLCREKITETLLFRSPLNSFLAMLSAHHSLQFLSALQHPSPSHSYCYFIQLFLAMGVTTASRSAWFPIVKGYIGCQLQRS